LMGVMIQHIAKDHGGPVEPRHTAKRRKIGLHRIVAIALLPARRPEAGNGLHFHIGCQQIVATMGLLESALHEELGLETLAHEAGLHIDKASANSFDTALRGILLQLIERILCGHGSILIERRSGPWNMLWFAEPGYGYRTPVRWRCRYQPLV